MKTAYTASCLLPLVLLAACLSDTNAGKIYDTCAVNADCLYAHGNCITPDECMLGMCYCVHGYSPVDNICKDLKTIDETCDDSTDTCYSGTCTGNRCVCASGRPASEDKKSCGRNFGESCSVHSECANEMKCLTTKCDCDTNHTHVVVNQRTVMSDRCVHKNATLDVPPNGECDISDYSSSTAKLCRVGLYCGMCPGGRTSNQKKCYSDTSEMSASKLSLVVPILAAMFMSAIEQ